MAIYSRLDEELRCEGENSISHAASSEREFSDNRVYASGYKKNDERQADDEKE